jgi:hypothetical protein
MAKKSDEVFTPETTVARREAALKRMLSTPHKPHKPISKRKKVRDESASADCAAKSRKP